MLGKYSPSIRRRKCNPELLQQRQIDSRIRGLLEKEKLEYESTHRILMLGPDGSGKSTLFNMICKMQISDMTEEEKRSYAAEIKGKMRDAIVAITSAMSKLNPPVEFQCEDNRSHARYILTKAIDFHENRDFTNEFFGRVKSLWTDEGVQKCYDRRSEYCLIDGAKFLLDKVETIGAKDYIPSCEDIMKCISTETGISESKLCIGGFKLHIVKMSNEVTSIRNWFHYFTDSMAIIFVADASSYNESSSVDPRKNRLKEALEMFKSIKQNDMLKYIPVILLLNKSDLFQKKIQLGNCRLEDHFPRFKQYQIPSDTGITEDKEVARARYFIRDEFLRLNHSRGADRLPCYSHFSCSNNLENISWIFNDISKIYSGRTVKRYDLL